MTFSKKLPSLTIFFPFFNDAQTVAPLLSQAYHIGNLVADALEVIALHGGPSSDHTLEEILKAKAQYPDLRVVDRSDNQEGYAVIRHGFQAATMDWVFYTDGDGQYQLDELPILVTTALTSHSSVVNGFKSRRADSWMRTLAGKGYQGFCRVLFRLPIRDVDCDFRLIERKLLSQIEFRSRGSSILPELILQLQRLRATFSEVPVTHYPRIYGTSNYSVFSLFKEKFIGDLSLYLTWRRESRRQEIFHAMREVEETLWWYVGLRETLLDSVRKIPLTHPTIYDLGCGTGRNMLALQQAGYHVQGIDISQTALELCRKRGLKTVLEGSITQLPLLSNSGDIALVTDVLCMLTPEQHTLAVKEIHRILRPGGSLILHEPAWTWLRSQHDLSCQIKARFQKKKLISLLHCHGFEIDDASYRVSLLFPLVASVKLLKQWMLRFYSFPQSDLVIPRFNRLFLTIQRAENVLLRQGVHFALGSSILIRAHKRCNHVS